MALIKCFECGTDVSEYADKCPKCGCPTDIIKEHVKEENVNDHLIVLCTGATIDLTGLEDKITENDLRDWGKLYSVLEKDFGLELFMCSIVDDILKYNDYKFPQNYQAIYETLCEYNRSRRTNIKCPTCGSTNVKRISSGERWASAVFGSWYDKTARSQFECKKCGYMW